MQSIRKKSFAAEQLARQKKKSPATIAIIVLAVVIAVGAVGYAVYLRFGEKEMPTEAVAPVMKEKPSIAVLPFYNLSDDKEDEYFSDGFTDDIIINLQKISHINVRSFTSVLQYKKRDKSLIDIARELTVDIILEGTIRKFEDTLKINAQLIDAKSDIHLWGDTYESELDELFDIHIDIIRNITDALDVELSTSENALIETKPTENIEAYDLYLKGHPRTNDERIKYQLLDDIKYFEMAIEIDPEFAEAYIGIAFKYNYLGYNSLIPPKEAFPKAEEATTQALEIDSSLAEAYTQRGWINLYYNWDSPEAEKNFKRAIKLNPNYFLAHRWYKDYFMVIGDFQTALDLIKKSYEIDPFATSLGQIAMNAIYAGNYDEARDYLRQAKEIDPDDIWVFHSDRALYIIFGEYDKALEVNKRLEIVWKDYPPSPGNYAVIYSKMGEKEKVEQILLEYIKLYDEGSMRCYDVAEIYMLLGDYDNAFIWLEKSYENREPWLLYIKGMYWWEPIRSDPRYKKLINKIGYSVK